MLKRFFRDSAVYSLSTIVSRGISLLLVPLYTRVLAPGDYGTIDILTILGNLINLTIALEVSQGLARYFGEKKDGEAGIEYASTALLFTLFVYTLFLVAGLGFIRPFTSLVLGTGGSTRVMTVAVLSMWGNGVFYLVQNQLRWRLEPKKHAISSVAFTGVSVGLAVLLIVVFDTGVIGVFYGKLAGYIVGCITALIFARSSYRSRFSISCLKRMLGFSLPLVPSSVAVFVAMYIDRIAIRTLLDLGEVGVYGIGYRLSSIVSLVMVGFGGAMMPLVYSSYRRRETPGEIARIFRYFLSIIIPLILFLSVFSREIIVIFTTEGYYPAASVIPLLTAAIVFSNMYIFAPGLSIRKMTKYIALLNGAAAGINTLLNFLLIPVLGIRGAGLATLLSAALAFTGHMILSQKFYPVPHRWPPTLIAASIGFIVVFTGSGPLAAGPLSLFLRIPLFLIGSFIIILILIGAGDLRRILGDLFSKRKDT